MLSSRGAKPETYFPSIPATILEMYGFERNRITLDRRDTVDTFNVQVLVTVVKLSAVSADEKDSKRSGSYRT